VELHQIVVINNFHVLDFATRDVLLQACNIYFCRLIAVGLSRPWFFLERRIGAGAFVRLATAYVLGRSRLAIRIGRLDVPLFIDRRLSRSGRFAFGIIGLAIFTNDLALVELPSVGPDPVAL
jgi:hypothetical protein